MAASSIDKERQKKKEKKVYLIIGVALCILFVLYMGHSFAIMRDDARAGADAFMRGLPDIILNPAHMYFSQGELIITLSIVGVALFLVVNYLSDKELKKHDNPDTVNGSAHFMTADELDEYNRNRTEPFGETSHDGPGNMILSKDIFLSLDGFKTRRNCNTLVIGGSGAGKSRYFAAPNILQYNANFVITDPSGEMLDDYGKALEDNGYRVRVFNLTDVYRGNRYNPFVYINEEKDVYLLVETLIKNTTPPDKHSGDPFWENSEKLLLIALILYLWHVPDAKLRKMKLRRDFSSVCHLLDMAEVDENDPDMESQLDVLFEELAEVDPDNLAVQNYHSFKQGAGKTLKSILISVGVRLKSFRLSDIKYLTSEDEFEFDKFADTRQALFVIIPTADTTFNFIVSLMYSQLFLSLYNYVETRAQYGWEAYIDDLTILNVEQAYSPEESPEAEKKIDAYIEGIRKGTSIRRNEEKDLYELVSSTGDLITWRGDEGALRAFQARLSGIKKRKAPRRCPNHVRLILDEFANIGQIPDFDQKLATIRKYGISCAIILQAISQLKDLYDKKWNTLAANCDTKLFLGCDDEDTIKWLLEFLGKKTTVVQNTSYQEGKNGGGSTSYNRNSIELMTVDAVTMMGDDECIVRVRGERPYYGKKYELTKHPNYRAAHETSGKFIIPVSDAVKEREHGPLWKRGSRSKMKELEESSGQVPERRDTAPSGREDAVTGTSQFDKNSNKARADEAKAAREEARRVKEEKNELAGQAQQAYDILDTFGLKPGASDAQIQEAVETALNIKRMEGTPSYGST